MPSRPVLRHLLTVHLLLLAAAAGAAAPAEPARRPDLVVHLQGPATAPAGAEIGEGLRLIVENVGTGSAWGTRRHPAGYMVDLTLGRDRSVSVGFKAYSPHFAEDVLLQGGRISATEDLAPRAAHSYAASAVLPPDLEPGRYFLCAYADPGNVVQELHELNNVACLELRVVPPKGGRADHDRPTPQPEAGNEPDGVRARAQDAPRITGFSPPGCVGRGGTLEIRGERFRDRRGVRLVELGGHGIGLLLEITAWADTRITVRIPDDPRLEHGQWYYVGIQDHDRRWLSNIDRAITICGPFQRATGRKLLPRVKVATLEASGNKRGTTMNTWQARTRSSKFALVLLAALLLAAAGHGAFSGTDVFLPSVGRADGAASWYTSVWVHNPGDTTAYIQLTFLERNKDNTAAVSQTASVASGRTVPYADLPLFSGRFGALRVQSTVNVLVTSRIYSMAAGETVRSSKGQGFAGIPASFAIGAGQKTQLLGLTQTNPASNSELRYNYGFVETTGNACTVKVTPLDDDGVVLADSKTYSVLPLGQHQYQFKDEFPYLSAYFGSRLEVEVTAGEGRIIAFGSGITNEAQDPTTFEMQFDNSLLTGGGGEGISSVNGIAAR